VKALEQMVEFVGAERSVMVARELSKLHEQMVRGTAEEVLAYFTAHPDKVRGEIVIVIAGK
jgi:16S rRNA (cytidine1402-2'-O)-methyltransferase